MPSHERSRQPTRRTLLRRGGLALAGSSIGLTAGCVSGDSTPSPTPTTTDSPTATDTPASTTAPEAGWSGPSYGEWLPAPGTVLPVEQYQFGAPDFTEYAAHQGALPTGFDRVLENWQPMDLDWQGVELCLIFHGQNVIRAEFDRSAIETEIAGTDGWTDVGEYRGFGLFEPDESKAVGVDETAIVVAHGYGEAGTAAETARGIIDTKRGEVARYPAADDAVGALLGEFEGGFVHQWRPRELFGTTPQIEPEFDGQVGIGKWGTFVDGPTAEVKYVIVYEGPDAVDLDQIETYVEDHRAEGELFAAWEGDISYRQNGRLGIIEGTATRDPESRDVPEDALGKQ